MRPTEPSRSLPLALASAILAVLALTATPPAAAGIGSSAAEPASLQAGGSDAERAFEKLKGLAGHWRGTSANGDAVDLEYEVVAGGSAVVEHLRPAGGEPAEAMVTVYHLDGDDLLLTHYCVAGNQPTMRAVAIEGDRVRFELSSITNLAAPGAGHMRRAVHRFLGPDRFTTAWTFRVDGEDRDPEMIEAERVIRAAGNAE